MRHGWALRITPGGRLQAGAPRADIPVERLRKQIGSLRRLTKNAWPQLWMSNAPRYRSTVLTSALECRSLRNPLANPERTFIAGHDPVGAWDVRR